MNFQFRPKRKINFSVSLIWFIEIQWAKEWNITFKPRIFNFNPLAFCVCCWLYSSRWSLAHKICKHKIKRLLFVFDKIARRQSRRADKYYGRTQHWLQAHWQKTRRFVVCQRSHSKHIYAHSLTPETTNLPSLCAIENDLQLKMIWCECVCLCII